MAIVCVSCNELWAFLSWLSLSRYLHVIITKNATTTRRVDCLLFIIVATKAVTPRVHTSANFSPTYMNHSQLQAYQPVKSQTPVRLVTHVIIRYSLKTRNLYGDDYTSH